MNKDVVEKVFISESTYTQMYEKELINIICSRLGIIIHSHQKKDLYNTLLEACDKFDCTAPQYMQMLRSSTDHSPLLEHLIIKITIGETYFFRDSRQMDILQNIVLSNLITKKRKENNLSLRIWSAGCASGEEIYTVAMMLDEMLNDRNKWTVSLLGTDINTHALAKAIVGRYGEWSMRSIPDRIKSKYFTKDNSQYVLTEKITGMVKFDYVNLRDDTYPSIFNSTNSLDLIICRNVLIYFDAKIISELMQKFYACLTDDGYLLLGASDPLDATIFKSNWCNVENTLFARSNQKANLDVQTHHIDDQIKKLPKKTEKTVISIKPSIESKKTAIISKDKLTHMLNHSEWQAMLFALDQINLTSTVDGFYLYAKAAALANLGKLEQAIEFFLASLKIDPANKYSHFTYALTLLELNKFNEAENELRKSIYLDRHFVIGYYQLGLLQLRNKRTEDGLKCLKNALVIAITKDPNDEVHGSSGLSYGRLSEILKREINIYSELEGNINA